MQTRRSMLSVLASAAATSSAFAQASNPSGAGPQQPAMPKIPPLAKTLVPAETALLLVDFQNTFAAPGGEYYSRYEPLYKKTKMIEKTVALVRQARELGVQIVQVMEGYSDDYRELDWGNGAQFHRSELVRQDWKTGTWFTELYGPLKPGPGDQDILLPNRITVSGFGSNGLDTILRNRGIKNIGLGGFATEGCVYATMLAGYDLGYRIFTITDAIVSTRDELSKLLLEDRYPQYSRVVDANTFIAMVSSHDSDVKKNPT